MPKPSQVLFLVVFAASLTACPGPRPPPDASATPDSAIPTPRLPSGYKTIAPLPAETSAQMLAQTASVFTGTLRDVRFTFDDCAGPRTHYVFANATSLLGSAVAPEVTLKVLGGPLPGGRWLSVSEVPRLALDAEYVVFLRNTDWTYSPVVAADLVFRKARVGDREVLIDPQGHALTGWNASGPVVSGKAVSDAVGLRLKRDRTQTGTQAPSASTDAKPEAATNAQRVVSPTTEQIRASGRFDTPALHPDAIADVRTVTTEEVSHLLDRAAADAHVRLGGRVTLDPYFRCWSVTRTQASRKPR